MKKYLIAGALAAGLLLPLGGCSTLQNLTDPAKRQQIITQAQQIAVSVCGFLPTVETVANILTQNNPLLLSAEQIGTGICQAVGTAPTAIAGKATSGQTPMLANVPVVGVRVR